jgi:hypothetical protein
MPTSDWASSRQLIDVFRYEMGYACAELSERMPVQAIEQPYRHQAFGHQLNDP